MAITLRPDKTLYTSPREAIAAPPETVAYSVTIDPEGRHPDRLVAIDVDAASTTYGSIVGHAEMPSAGDELHHFGWNVCSSALCPWAPHPHVARRYLLLPGLRSSNIHVVDVGADPRSPRLVKTITAEQIARKAGYSRPHTVHCGPDGIYVSALGSPSGDAPGGIFVLDHDTFEVRGPWEADRGPQELAYDFWWHLTDDTLLSSEWGTPKMVEEGVNGEILMAGEYGHRLHVWDLPTRRHRQVIDLGKENQMVLELRPAHEPGRRWGFVGVVTSLADLSGSVWLWEMGDDRSVSVKKVIQIPAEPADASLLPPVLQPFGAVPPLVTDINLSLDDRWLYVSLWGTGDIKRYDVSDPHKPVETASVRLGGIVSQASHPARPETPLNGGPQMVEVSRDGRRVYLSNSLYLAWDRQFYPNGIDGWVVKLDAGEDGSLQPDPGFFLDTGAQRAHQIHLQGGDASSDSYCFPS
jgi:selenium-binding protein 1